MIVNQLVERRKKLRLSQKVVAERAGLKQSAIARVENCGAVPRLDTLERIALVLGLELKLVARKD